VLHVHTLPVVSGSGINTLLTMRGLAERGYEVDLACRPGGRLEEVVREEGLGFRPIPHFVAEVSPHRDLLALAELVGLLRRERYGVVHTHNSKGGVLGRLAARIARVPVVIHTVHGFAFHGAEKPLRRWCFLQAERVAARWCDAVIYISRPLARWAARERLYPACRGSLIYSGIEPERFDARPDAGAVRAGLGVPPGAPLIGQVSKLWEGKGHATLLAALPAILARFPDTRLAFVGEGPLQGTLEAEAARRGLADRVIFTGFREDVAAVTGALDVALLASAFEGMGRVVLEAMACGVPVVASRVGGIPDLVVDGRTGYLVPVDDAAAVAGAVTGLLAEPERRRRLGEEGRRRLTGRFTAERMVEQIADLYRGLGAA
jgi:glycosyltransferase involved in cell wall biosynthesis